MSDFSDLFNRANASDLANGWVYKYRHENSGAAVPWRIVSDVARPPTDTGINVIAYRSGLQAGFNTFQCIWTIKNPVGSNDAEMCFRYDATNGHANARWSVVIVGGNGSLQKRSWAQGAGAETDTVVATWVRTANNEFTITVDVTDADLITVYDSGFTGLDFKAAEITDSYNAANTGIGMVSGWYDSVVFDDIGQGSSADFDAADITAAIRCDVRVDGPAPAPGAFPDVLEHFAGFNVEDYAVIDGIGQSVAGITRTEAVMSISYIAQSDTGTPPAADAINTGADQRFLPNYYFAPGSWNAMSGGLSLAMSSTTDPFLKAGYRYSAVGGTRALTAICFAGTAYARLTGFAGAPAQTDYTVAITAVLKSAPAGKDYGVFMSDTTDEGDASLGTPIGVLYRTGELELNVGKRLIARESWKSVGKPTTIILSLSGTEGGKLLIQDAKRTVQDFATDGVDRSGRLFFGAHMNIVDGFSANTAGELDVLEIDYWTRALSAAEMMEHNNLMSAVYGVSP